ncbi:MAG: T9SS type A sorting domain-containing protein [Bacteroidetes bacterium]|nr:T9SS type A sorting domain-containing protein [Bacteroidota bacterium]
MKIKIILIVILFLPSLIFCDTFASRIKITNPNGSIFDGNFKDGTLAAINYILNDTADNVIIKIVDEATNSAVVTINAGKQIPGKNNIIWDGTGSVTNKKYFAQVTTNRKTYSSTKYSCFSFVKTYETKAIYTRGVDANKILNHPSFGYIYAANSDASDERLKTGILRFNSDITYAGSDTDHPILLNTLGNANIGGTIDWGSTAPWYSTLDNAGRIFATSNSGGKIFKMSTDTSTPKVVAKNISQPRGIAAFGAGNNFRLFIAADTIVLRAQFVGDDTATSIDTIAKLSNYVRDVIIDDEGNLIAALRAGVTGGAGIAVEKYSLSGQLPVRRINAVWSVSFGTGGSPIGLALKRGSNLSSADDDTLYVSVRGASGTDTLNIGVHEITSLNGFFPEAKLIFKPALFPGSIGGNISTNADLTVDYAGNIILFENGNEEIFSIAPPNSTSTRAITTRSYGSVTVNISSNIGKENIVPTKFVLHQNFPNPFNPTTTINFSSINSAKVKIIIYDVLGNEVCKLYDSEISEGNHSVVWNGKGNNNESVSSGIYFYNLIANSKSNTPVTISKSMILMK